MESEANKLQKEGIIATQKSSVEEVAYPCSLEHG